MAKKEAQEVQEVLVANKDTLVDYMAQAVTAKNLEDGTNKKLTKKMAAQAFDALFEGIEVSLSSGIPVKINGYVQFDIRATEARTARNPKTGEPVEVSAGYRVHAAPKSRLKAAVASL